MELNQSLLNISEALREMDHKWKAEVIDDFNMESTSKINELEKEVERLTSIFEKLDRIHCPHEPGNLWGMLDSPQSLLEHTRKYINFALKKEI